MDLPGTIFDKLNVKEEKTNEMIIKSLGNMLFRSFKFQNSAFKDTAT